jgi:hypothetical protein
MNRAADASSVLADLKITHCTACDQVVANDGVDHEHCFLCHQSVQADSRCTLGDSARRVTGCKAAESAFIQSEKQPKCANPAKNFEFERAATLRDTNKDLRTKVFLFSQLLPQGVLFFDVFRDLL